MKHSSVPHSAWSKNILEFAHLHPLLQVRFCNLRDGEMQAASIRLLAPASLAVRTARQHALHGNTHCTSPCRLPRACKTQARRHEHPLASRKLKLN